jgi:hypothetical protein
MRLSWLTIDRDQRTDYINALEKADGAEFQDIVDIFSNDQIKSIQQSLNWDTVDSSAGYNNVLNIIEGRLSLPGEKRQIEIERNNRIKQNIKLIYEDVLEELNQYAADLRARIDSAGISVKELAGENNGHNDFVYAIFPYAKTYNYFANLNFDSYSAEMMMEIGDKKHWLIISVHHYGYDNSAVAIGAVMLQHGWPGKYNISNEITPIKVPPLTVSSEKELPALKNSIHNHIENILTAALVHIASTI